MYHHAVDVVVELHPPSGPSSPCTGDDVGAEALLSSAYIVRARLVSPLARKWKPPEATWSLKRNTGLYLWQQLTTTGVPVGDLNCAADHTADRAAKSLEKMVSALQSALGVTSWTFSLVPAERWSARRFVAERDAVASVQRQRVVDFLRHAPSHSGLSRLSLHDYQLDGVAFVLALMSMKCRGSVVADEMGLGKTLQALVVMACLVAATPTLKVLVVCPGYLRQNWVAEAQKWGVFDAAPQLMRKLVDRPEVSSTGCTFVLSSYEWLTSAMGLKSRGGGGGDCLDGFDLVVFDEAHLLKKQGARAQDCSLRNRAAQKLMPMVGHAMFLTGTPCPNATKELFSLLRLTGSLDMGYPEFAFRYCKRYFNAMFTGWDDRGASAEHELQCLQTRMVRRLAKDHLDLPDEVDVFVQLETPTTREMSKLNRERETLKKRLASPSLTDREREKAAERLQHNRTMQLVAAGRAKAGALKQYFRQYLQDYPAGAPFLVFAYHQEVFDALEELFDSLGVAFGCVNGRVAKAEVDEIFTAFYSGGLRVLVLSLAMTAGLNLQQADTAFFAEVRWSPGDLRQAQTRICRQGTRHNRVKYVWLFGAPIDREVYEGCLRKEKTLRRALKKRKRSETPAT
jgi:SWI/SNF-related matrix-associated actin-dependent regulator 1 of chromatin subfamily A